MLFGKVHPETCAPGCDERQLDRPYLSADGADSVVVFAPAACSGVAAGALVGSSLPELAQPARRDIPRAASRAIGRTFFIFLLLAVGAEEAPVG